VNKKIGTLSSIFFHPRTIDGAVHITLFLCRHFSSYLCIYLLGAVHRPHIYMLLGNKSVFFRFSLSKSRQPLCAELINFQVYDHPRREIIPIDYIIFSHGFLTGPLRRILLCAIAVSFVSDQPS